MAAPYSDLQLAPPHPSQYSGLHVPDYSGLHHYETETVPPPPVPDDHKGFEPLQPPKRTVCGLAAKTFWVLLAVITAVVVIGAAVGGGVGGVMASKQKKYVENAAAAISSSSSPSVPAPIADISGTPTPQTPAPTSQLSTGPITTVPANGPAITTTQVPGPHTTLISDCPSSNNTLYTIDIGTSMSWRKICDFAYFNDGDTQVVNTPTTSLNDCINLCATYNIQNAVHIRNGAKRICNAVCWRNTFAPVNPFPGQCFGFTTQNSTGEFVLNSGTADVICNSAAWINQSF